MKYRAIEKQLFSSIREFEESVLGSNSYTYQPLLSCQNVSILADYEVKKFKLPFNYVDREKLQQTLLTVINNNDLLRSTVVKRKGKLFWKIHKSVTRISLPELDLRTKSTSEKEAIITELLQSKYITNSPSKTRAVKNYAALPIVRSLYRFFPGTKLWFFKNLLRFSFGRSPRALFYKIILVRFSQKENLLFISVDHTIGDNYSFKVFIDDIIKTYKGAQIGSKLSYQDYITQVQQGPECNEEYLNQLLNLDKYQEYSSRFIKKNSYLDQYFCYDTQISLSGRNEEFSNVINLSFQMSYQICRKMFGMDEIPFMFVFSTRNSRGKNFNNTIGLFQDFIPYVWDRDFSFDKLQGIIDEVYSNNINFLDLYYNPELNRKFEKVIQKVDTRKPVNASPNIIVNFELELEDAENDFLMHGVRDFDSLDSESKFYTIHSKDKVKALQQRGGCVFWLVLTRKKLELTIESNFKFTRNDTDKIIHQFWDSKKNKSEILSLS